MRTVLTTEEITDAEALFALQPAWWDLWRRSRSATPFQSPAWLIPWWRCFRPGALFAIAVRNERTLVGLAPFYIEDGPLGRRILPIGISLSDYLDVVFDPDFAGDAGRAMTAHLESRSALWDAVDLEELPPDARALGLRCPDGCSDGLTPQSACPVLRLSDGPDRFPGAVPKKKLQNLRTARNRLAGRKNAEVIQVGEDRLADFLDDLFHLHRARWKSRGEAGVLADDTVRRFHREAVEALSARNLLRLYLLRIEGRMAGAYYGFRHDDRAYYYLGGFDPLFSFESPGTILIGHAIEEAAREGAREFHFLRGQEAYKYDWGACDRWNQRRSFRRSRPEDHG
jgi:CelD/BcsL family acetyltransferase involved in cellulose biosynthesis